jgi:hypothetical protein
MSTTDRVLEKMYPVVNDDMKTYVGAICNGMFQEIDDYASDGDEGEQGWSILVDLNRIPDKGLDWLAQFKGVSFPPGLTPAQKRQQILLTSGWLRGTTGAMAAAPLPYLTGSKTVILRERDPAACPSIPAYGLTVITRTSETPDSAAVLRALIAQKPAGIILNYVVLAGQDYLILYNGGATTYANVFSTYATYAGVVNAAPGT